MLVVVWLCVGLPQLQRASCCRYDRCCGIRPQQPTQLLGTAAAIEREGVGTAGAAAAAAAASAPCGAIRCGRVCSGSDRSNCNGRGNFSCDDVARSGVFTKIQLVVVRPCVPLSVSLACV